MTPLYVDPNIAKAQTLDTAFYYSPEYFEIAKEKIFATANVTTAVDIAHEITPADGLILVTGSLYLVGEAKKILNN